MAERIQKMDPELGAIDAGAELGATVTGAELLGTGKWPARGLGARVNGAEPPAFNPAHPSSPSVLPLLSPPSRVFLSPLHPTSRIDILDLENLDLIRRSSRTRYTRSPPCFFRIDSVHISRIFEPKNRHHLGFHCIPQYIYYTTVG